MPSRQVIVDGSNLATEGRSLPSLTQLDQAVREYLAENPADVVTVVVDASFGHRINPSEVPMFEEAEAAGELVSPPAGAIGRGDAFLLRIAEKTGATVLSNDSFQEFHGEHPWLFEDGRLVGGKPVPGVGWIFLPRTPVRGQRSRDVVKEAKRRKRADEGPATQGTAPTSRESGLDLAAAKAKGRGKKVDRAIARATEEAVEPKAKGRRRRRTAGVPPAEAVNEPLAFITFIAAHPLGSEVAGTVLEFSSHGAFVSADGARCYLPLSAMGDPPPRRAREVLAKGEERAFVIQALDPQRRGIELALPGYARVAGGPTEETVEAEIHPRAEAAPKHRRREKADAAAVDGATPVEAGAPSAAAVDSPQVTEGPDAPAATPAKRLRVRKVAAVGTGTGAEADGQDASPGAPVATTPAPGRTAAAKKAPAEKAATPAKKGATKKAATKKAPAKKAAAKKEAAEAIPAKAAGAKKATARKASGEEVVAVTAPPGESTTGGPATPARSTAAKATTAGAATRARKAPAKATTAVAATRTRKAPAKATTAGATTAGATTAGATTADSTPAKATPADSMPAKATPARATPARASSTRKAAPGRKAAPLASPAAAGPGTANASGSSRTPRTRRTSKAVADPPDVAVEAEP